MPVAGPVVALLDQRHATPGVLMAVPVEHPEVDRSVIVHMGNLGRARLAHGVGYGDPYFSGAGMVVDNAADGGGDHAAAPITIHNAINKGDATTSPVKIADVKNHHSGMSGG
jgi:hypothetical protein